MHDCAANQNDSVSRRDTQVYTCACAMFARLIKKRERERPDSLTCSSCKHPSGSRKSTIEDTGVKLVGNYSSPWRRNRAFPAARTS